MGLALAGSGAGVLAGGYGTGPGPIAVSPFSGFNPVLARAPYVTDLTQTSAVINWATNPNIHGSVTYGPAGNCTANTVPVATGMVTQIRVSPNPAVYASRYDYQSSVPITGLNPGTTYCYEVFGSGSSAVDLLPPSQPYQTFTTLDPVDPSSTSPLTFAVVGDFGETANRGAASNTAANNPSSVNSNQAAIQALIGSSGARFIIGVGDVAYNDGGNYNFGDLQQTGSSIGSPGLTEISDVFGPYYWPQTGGIPFFTAGGNHGQNSNLLTTFPESTTATSSNGRYAIEAYPSVDGTNVANYPSDWYAFSSGNARFYVLDGAWSEANIGTAAGTACPYTAGGSTCKTYQVDADAHFQPSGPEYQWLVSDLHAHPGGVKLAFFHFPLRSDNATQDSDVYLQQALEPVLAQNGVQIAFNGHAHDYERNLTAGPNTILSYVTGGGGGVISTVAGKGCSPWDAYAIGWTYSSGTGQKCGSAPAPTSDAQVYHFLKVTIQANTVVVSPINAAGQVFDEQTYNFVLPTPTAPSDVVATATGATTINLTWTASTEAGGSIASYQIARNGVALTTVSGSMTSYADTGLQPTTQYTYSVTAVDQGGVVSQPGVSNVATTLPTPLPTAPSNVVATATGATTINLTWTASTEVGGSIASYQVARNGVALTTVSGSASTYADTALQPATQYTYSVTAVDQGGVVSQPGVSNAATTPLMTTGFEAGTMAGWSPVVGQVSVQTGLAHGGADAAALTSTGGQTFALQNLPSSSTRLYAQAWIYVASQSTTMTLLGLRTQATPTSGAYQVAQVYLNASGTVKVLNNVSKASYLGNTTLAPQGWHEVTFEVDESAGTIQVWLDGNAVQFSTPAGWTAVLTGQNLGSVPMSNLQVGDDSSNRVYTWYADDIVVSTVAPPP